MDDLRTKIDQLDINQREYVFARSKTKTDRAAYVEAGVSKAAFYLWGEKQRNYLNDIASRLHSERKYKAEQILEESIEEATMIKIAGLKSRDEKIRQNVSTEILDRVIGKPSQPVSAEFNGEITMLVKYSDELHDNPTETP